MYLSKEQQVWNRRAEEKMNSTYDGPQAMSHAQWKETPGGQDYLKKKASSGEAPSRPNWSGYEEEFSREWDEAEAYDLFWNFPWKTDEEPPEEGEFPKYAGDGWWWTDESTMAELGPCEEEMCDDPADPVNHPSHYTNGSIECIEVIREVTKDLSGPMAYYIGNVIKYIWRHKYKNGREDLEKAQVYLGWAVDALG